MHIKQLALLSLAISLSVFSHYSTAKETKVSVTEADNVQWGYLNPLRGDKSPGAADLWGDRTKDTATGMLVRFNKGFSSPPHIHNITYRGIVIQGAMHNDDPTAANMWMPTGSYWTQPAGEDHVTAADGMTNLIYLEIDHGPYLVKPSKEAFDNGERPINQHIDNMVWQTFNSTPSIELTHLWGSSKSGELGGSLIKITDDFSGDILSQGNEFKLVVIAGSLSYQNAENTASKKLNPGSFVSTSDDATHKITAQPNTLLYVRSENNFKFAN